MANTPNLGLHQWDADDAFLRTDFNEDLSKIDTAVKARTRCVTGCYQGTGSGGNPVVIDVGFWPVCVLVSQQSGGGGYGVMAVRDGSVSYSNQNILKITPTGFEAGLAFDGSYAKEPFTNMHYRYSYIAFE